MRGLTDLHTNVVNDILRYAVKGDADTLRVKFYRREIAYVLSLEISGPHANQVRATLCAALETL
jgi:hypothetical protein